MENSLTGMTERELLVQLNERVFHLSTTITDNDKRLRDLEKEVIGFKTEINTRLKIYTAIASLIATAVGSLVTQILNHLF